ncbi:MAG: hypothetical protein FD126_2140 [Elusimicrobia bacterium]|nr:MAG: hypothetical protein FD126_2140 [Elusimicrobiota bacterium]
MLRKLTALLLGVLLSLIPRALLGTVFGQTQDIVAELMPGAYPYLMSASVALEFVVAYAMAFVMGFAFWAGTSETWQSSGAWGGSAAAALLVVSNPLGLSTATPVLLALALAVRVGGAFHGAWWGERFKDDPRVEGIQGFIFRLNPFPLH